MKSQAADTPQKHLWILCDDGWPPCIPVVMLLGRTRRSGHALSTFVLADGRD